MATNAVISPAGSMTGATGLRARIAAVTSFLGRFPLSVHQLLFRWAIAGVFFRTGLQKVRGWETTIALFSDEYKLPGLPPEIAAIMASSFELGCSTLLMLGLATRLATLPLLGMIMAIQIFVYPQAWPEHLVWGSILVFLLTRGPGALSIDRLIGLAFATLASRVGAGAWRSTLTQSRRGSAHVPESRAQSATDTPGIRSSSQQ